MTSRIKNRSSMSALHLQAKHRARELPQAARRAFMLGSPRMSSVGRLLDSIKYPASYAIASRVPEKLGTNGRFPPVFRLEIATQENTQLSKGIIRVTDQIRVRDF